VRKAVVVFGAVMVMGVLGVVAPAAFAPNANRAEALIRCPTNGGVIARNGPYAAWVTMCVEHLQNDVRAMAYVHCYSGSGDVACNWEFKNLELWRDYSSGPVRFKQGYAHATGVSNGYIAAQDHGWAPCPNLIVGGSWHSQSPAVFVRFPNGVLSGPRSVKGSPVVHQNCY
jgi:hypothetical protein